MAAAAKAMNRFDLLTADYESMALLPGYVGVPIMLRRCCFAIYACQTEELNNSFF